MNTAAPPARFDSVLTPSRQLLFRLAALSVSDPRHGGWDLLNSLRRRRLAPDAATVLREAAAETPAELGPGELPLEELTPAELLRQLPRTPRRFNDAYEATFGLLVAGACPPYEMEYVDERQTFQRSQRLADLRGYYRAFGLAPSRRHPERPDHLVLELEFAALLLLLERRAVDSAPGTERADICRAAQQRFFREHLSWWTPAFAALLARHAGGGYYEAAARFLAALITAERRLSALEPPRDQPQPRREESPGMCNGCQLAE